MELIELYESMIKSIIKKYLGYAAKVWLDYDDLYQEASMAVLQAENTYKDNKDMKLETWIYNNVEWHLQRVLKKNSKYKDIISINSEIINQKNDTVSLLDLIADDTDYFQKVDDAIMVQTYKEEAKRVSLNFFNLDKYSLPKENSIPYPTTLSITLLSISSIFLLSKTVTLA